MSEPRGPGGPFKCERCGLVHFGACRDQTSGMSLADVELGVVMIRGLSGDDEAAHGEEDELRQRVLEAIATGADNPAELAAAVLRTGEIAFNRWCA